MKKRKGFILLVAIAVLMMSSLTVSAHNLTCSTCTYPDCCYVCRGAYYVTSVNYHVISTPRGPQACNYVNYSHGNNIKCKFGHLKYTDVKHNAGSNDHTMGCARTYACNGIGTVIY